MNVRVGARVVKRLMKRAAMAMAGCKKVTVEFTARALDSH
jgi:hypothetical protein